MNNNFCRIRPKPALDIAREWVVVKNLQPPGAYIDSYCPFPHHRLADLLAEFAELYAKQLEFERDTYKKLAEDMMDCQPLRPIIMSEKGIDHRG